MNVLLVAVPLSFISHFAGWGALFSLLLPPLLRFFPVLPFTDDIFTRLLSYAPHHFPLPYLLHERAGSTADFIISFIAIVPLASLLGDATEQCSLKLGQTIGGLLNATLYVLLAPPFSLLATY